METTKFILIRHGETIWNKEHKMQGQTDIPLSKVGIKQAKQLSIHLKDIHLDILYSSPLKRASKTAKQIHQFHTHIPFLTHDSLKERSFGDLEGITYEDIILTHPRMAFDKTWDYPYFQPPKGECLIDVRKRAEVFLHDALSHYEGKTIAIVSHGVTLRIIIQILVGLPFSSAEALKTENTSCAFIEFDPKTKGHIHFINHMKHLE